VGIVSGFCLGKKRTADVGKTLLTAWSFVTVLKRQKHDSMKHVEYEEENEEVGGGREIGEGR